MKGRILSLSLLHGREGEAASLTQAPMGGCRWQRAQQVSRQGIVTGGSGGRLLETAEAATRGGSWYSGSRGSRAGAWVVHTAVCLCPRRLTVQQMAMRRLPRPTD